MAKRYSPADFGSITLGTGFVSHSEAREVIIPPDYLAMNLAAITIPSPPRNSWRDIEKEGNPTVRGYRTSSVPVSYHRTRPFIMPSAGFIADQPVANTYTDPTLLDPVFREFARRSFKNGN